MAAADNLHNQRVTVFGLGRLGGGVGVARYAAEQGARVTVTDTLDAEALADSIQQLEGLPITFHLGGHEVKDFLPDGADIVVRNPGVPRNSEFLLAARDHGVIVEMEMSLFFRACAAPIIGVTGTKGKTTVSTLIGDMLWAWRPDAVTAGNMGISALAALASIRQDTPVVIELSSWQLEALDEHGLGPAIAVLTNIHEDHLSHYDGFEDYASTKRSIARHLGPDDIVVYNAAQPDSARVAEGTNARLLPFDVRDSGVDGAWATDHALCVRWDGHVMSWPLPGQLSLSGSSGIANALAAAAAATARGVPGEAIGRALAQFAGVPHRLEQVSACRGMTFINDTSATAPAAAASTISLLATSGGALTVIAGGADKATDFAPMAMAIVQTGARIVLLEGSGTQRLRDALAGLGVDPPLPHGSLPEAFEDAVSGSERPGVVALSPGCASFGMFRNEFDRGEQFRHLASAWCGGDGESGESGESSTSDRTSHRGEH